MSNRESQSPPDTSSTSVRVSDGESVPVSVSNYLSEWLRHPYLCVRLRRGPSTSASVSTMIVNVNFAILLFLCLLSGSVISSVEGQRHQQQLLDGAGLDLGNDLDLPVSWYWNSMIHNQDKTPVLAAAPRPEAISLAGVGGGGGSGLGFDDYGGNGLAYIDEPVSVSRENLQQYLDLVLNWNWEMTPVEWNYYCKGKMPNMRTLTSGMDKDEFFWNMNPAHMGTVMKIHNELNAARTPLAAIRLAACMRDDPTMNTNAWFRALTMTLIYGPSELRTLHTPPPQEVMPGMFIYKEVIEEAAAQQGATAVALTPFGRYTRQIGGQEQCVPVNGLVGADNGPENLLWYWREDVWLNSFHWYWHLTYPFMGQQPNPRGDRRGELLYYSHHSICARYHAERLSVGLPTVEPLELYPEASTRLPVPYNPHLHDANSGRVWTPRRVGSIVQDVNVDGAGNGAQPMVVDLTARLQQLGYILQAIDAGVALTQQGIKIPLRTREGIDILGDMIEASVYTINRDLYGYPGVHNDAHIAIGLVEDPQGELGLPPGVMADPSVAMRDPIFYQYHVQVDAIFDRYKSTLPPYQPEGGELALVVPGVQVVGLAVLQHGANVRNKLETYFTESVYDLARGLDFNRSAQAGPIQVCVHHLDYSKFSYEIMIKRDPIASTSGRATVRLFLAPRFNEQGRKYTMDEQRTLYFALDRFPVYLQPGVNKIVRKSTESTLTVPMKQSYATLQQDLANQRPHCGCGWPEHLLIPRGSERGLPFDLFVMVTNGDEDAVPRTNNPTVGPADGCVPAPIFCGIVGENYPDAKPMGYPFDRKPYPVLDGELGLRRMVGSIEEYVVGVPNMGTVPIRIYHRDTLKPGPGLGVGLGFGPPGGDFGPIQSASSAANNNLVNCVPYKYRYLCVVKNEVRKRR